MDDVEKQLYEKNTEYKEMLEFLFPIYEYFLGHSKPPFYYEGNKAEEIYKKLKEILKK